MEVAGVVFRQAPCFSSNCGDASNFRHLKSISTMKLSRTLCLKQQKQQQTNRKSVEFSDKSHLQYYNAPMMAIKEKEVASKKKEMKKKLKLLKGLSKNLSTFSEMGFCLNTDNGLDHQVKGQMISEATEVLLAQLQKLKAEELESKMKKKEEKAKKKATRMTMDCKESSSSESSSSESDCDNIVNTSQLKTITTPNPIVNPMVENSVKKIEVCMGGKCKKSGGAMLLENFEKAVYGEATVVGCKCMGKCRDGPNVRVCNNGDAVGSNPVCVGVGLEDVDLIVSNFFGGSEIKVPAFSGV